jgi:hypothetical protein
VSEHERPTEPGRRPDEPEYEPPRAEEISSEDRAATAAWAATGQPDDASN